MKILGIDTSCDDTSIALLEIENCKLKILSNIVSSQVKLHAKHGGVYPFLAKREHQKNLPLILKKAIKKARNPKVDLVAVTVGPGLEPCLWQGINFAEKIARKLKLSVVPVNHIEAHIVANFIRSKPQFLISNFQKIFPAVCLVVSGGHTQLILMRDIGKYKLIGETRDDAAGECFDKVARILGLGYPGGPAIAKITRKSPSKSFRERFSETLPRPMIRQKNYDFSFSGLKTAVLYKYRSQIPKSRFIKAMCAETQQAIVDVLVYKTLKAAKNYRVKSIILGGGVAANEELRKQFNWKLKIENCKFKFLVPPKIFCTDNAVMIALTAYFNQKERKKLKAEANLRI